MAGAGGNPANDFSTINNFGQIAIESTGDIEISRFTDATQTTLLTDPMPQSAFDGLGLIEGVTQPQNPSFSVQIGNNEPFTIDILPGETIADLEAKLTYNLSLIHI